MTSAIVKGLGLLALLGAGYAIYMEWQKRQTNRMHLGSKKPKEINYKYTIEPIQKIQPIKKSGYFGDKVIGYNRSVDLKALKKSGFKFDKHDTFMNRLYFTTPSGARGFINTKSGKRYYVVGNTIYDVKTYIKKRSKGEIPPPSRSKVDTKPTRRSTRRSIRRSTRGFRGRRR